jgi:seryl-tRNA synthetase
MLDPKFIRENAQKVRKNTLERNFDSSSVDSWLELDKQRSQLLQEIEATNRRKNEIAELLKDAKQRTPELIQEGKELKEKIEPLEKEIKELDEKWTDQIVRIPNIHFDDVPVGKDDSANPELRKVGTIPKFDFEPKDHVQIGKDLGILDFDTGSKVTGSQFYYLKNDAVRLEFALLQYGIDFFTKKGYEVVMTPDMAKSRFYLGTGYAPRGDEAQTYEITGEDLGLIATAEVTMAGMHADEVIPEAQLPLKYAAISHCFRKEAGAYGKYSKGLYRVHQFTKLEMFIYSTPEDSQKLHAELLAMEEEIVQSLEIPYRVIEMCSGDLGAMAAKKYDLEAWMPGRNDYGEITSTSNCTDFQSRNLNIRYKDKNGENKYLHMLNGTAIVLSRIPIAIMENFQQKDGTVKVPKALVPFFGKEYIGK